MTTPDPREGVKATPCPHCQRKLDAASHIRDESIRPRRGDLTVCIGCAEILRFGDDMAPVATSPDELAALDARTLGELRRVQLAIRAIKARGH